MVWFQVPYEIKPLAFFLIFWLESQISIKFAIPLAKSFEASPNTGLHSWGKRISLSYEELFHWNMVGFYIFP